MVDGFSSADPSLARGPQIDAGEATRRSGGGSSTPAPPNVRIEGSQVFIGGQGFSVAPSLQARFIQGRTGGRGSSAQAAISQAQETARAAEQQRQADQTFQAEAVRSQRVAAVLKAREQTARESTAPQQSEQQINQQLISKFSSKESIDRAAVAAAARRERAEKFRIGLSEKERGVSTGQVIKGRFKEVGTGVVKAGVGIAEGSVNLFSNLGVQLIEIDPVTGQRKERKQFRFGGKLGEIRDLPATTGTILGQTQVIAPLAGAAVAQFATTASIAGFSAATTEAAASISPFKIKSGSFGVLESQRNINKLKFDVVSLKSQKGGVTTKQIFGTTRGDTSVTIKATQVSKGFGSKEVGKTVSTITAPRTTLRPGQIETGVRSIRTETLFAGSKGAPSLQSSKFGIDSKSIQGAGTVGQTRTIADVRLSKTSVKADLNLFGKTQPITTGGLTQRGKVFDVFGSGQGSRIVRISPTSRSELVRIRDISTRGIEFDLSRASSSVGFKVSSAGPGSSLGLKQTTAIPVIPSPKISTSSIKSLTSTPASLGAFGVGRASQPKLSTPKQSQATQQFLSPQQPQAPKQKLPQSTLQTPTQGLTGATSTKTDQAVLQVPKIRSRSASRSDQTPAIIQTLATTPDTRSTTRQLPVVPTLQIPRTIPAPAAGINLGRPIARTLKTPSFAIPKLPKPQRSQRGFGGVGLEVRRGGKFFSLGKFKQPAAFAKGQKIVTGTLAATFRLTGASGITKAPKGFRIKQTSGGPLFIEKRGRRLSTESETREITAAKGRKKKKKTSRRKKK